MNMRIKFNLNSGFKLVEEGIQVLEIIKAEAKPSGKPTAIILTFKSANGGQLMNRYSLDNQGALNAFGLVCKYTLDTKDEDEIDTNKDLPRLVGKKIVCEIVHNEGTTPKEDGTFPKFANIKRVIGKPNETTATTARASISSVADDLD